MARLRGAVIVAITAACLGGWALSLARDAAPGVAAADREALAAALRPEIRTVANVRTVDGDTIDAPGLGKVRLVGINAPEVGTPGADEATAFTRAMVTGRVVEVAISPIEPVDKYGRHLGVVYVMAGGGRVCINSELLRRGLAPPYRVGPSPFDIEGWAKEEDAPRPSTLEGVPAPNPDTTWVYATRTGTKYHRVSCEHARNTLKLSLRSAVARGLEPCGVCRPPVMTE